MGDTKQRDAGDAGPGSTPTAPSTGEQRSGVWRRGWGVLAAVALNVAFVWLMLFGTWQIGPHPKAEDLVMVSPPRAVLPPLRSEPPQRPRSQAPLQRLPPLPSAAVARLPTMQLTVPVPESAPAEGSDSAGGGGRDGARGGGGALPHRLVDLRKRGLDVVFVIDATGSMDWVLADITSRVREIADALRSLVPLTRIGVAAYRDAEDPEFAVKVQPLTYSNQKLERFLGALRAAGGGGLQEGVDAGLEAAVRQPGWRKGAQAIMVLIGDAPPKEGSLGRIRATVRAFALAGGQLAVVDVSDQANPELVERETGRQVNHAMYRGTPMYEFELIAEAAGTRATTLRGDLVLPRRLVGLVLGIDAEPLLAAAGEAP
jgi:hypothetical protein